MAVAKPCRTSVAVHNAAVQHPLSTVSPDSNPTIVVFQTDAWLISKDNLSPFCRLHPSFIAPLMAEKSVFLRQSETWTLNLETIRALETLERKSLRTIFGPVKDQGCWRTRYNFKLYRLYKEQVTQVIRSNRLRWLGDIWRRPENNQIRAYTFKNPMGSRTRGRPPIRWIDDVENDLKTLNIKNWQRVAA
ncbi:endonuclease-reverse transcriptase [Trichonephila clavipes]|nr:endonuclease-reverse transcriptase [Trichonephila clavipes]